jgi:hypothetical protein
MASFQVLRIFCDYCLEGKSVGRVMDSDTATIFTTCILCPRKVVML